MRNVKRALSMTMALMLTLTLLAIPASAAKAPSITWLPEGIDVWLVCLIDQKFSNGLIMVSKGREQGTFGYVDVSGNVIVPMQYEEFSSANEFSEGLA